MSVETHNHQEYERYMEYQRAQRQQRVETLGGAATLLFLSTIDLGVIGASEPATERRHHQETIIAPEASVTDLRVIRERRLAAFAAESAELGYARVA